jgi:hypothetical protein
MKKGIYFLIMIAFVYQASAQKIIYTEPDREDMNNMSFDIIGKMNGNILVYKTVSSLHYISIYNAEMKQIDKFKLDYLTERVFNVDFVPYPDFAYMFYQYQKRSIIYCMAVKLDVNGKKVGEPMLLDTTDSREVQNNKIYSFVQSADKQKIQFFKINNSNERVHTITTILFDKNLTLINKSIEAVSMRERNSFLTAFDVDNKGNFAFLKTVGTTGNDNIAQVFLITKQSQSSVFNYHNITKPENIYLDEMKLKSNNNNNSYIITSFYSNKRRGDVQGIFVSIWDNNSNSEKLSSAVVFDNEFRNDAKGDASIKAAFNDFFIKDIITKKDGGFLLTSQCEYTTSRGNNGNLNRWDYLNNGSNFGGGNFYSFGGGNFNAASPWSRYSNSYNITRYYADNIAIISLDSSAKMQWSNVIRKSQFDDNNDAFVGYGMFNAGNQLKFLFNLLEKNQQMLNEQSINPDGQIIRSSTLKGLDKGYDFMPRNAKQVGAKQIIVPCMLRSFLCFAKIDY